MIHAYDLWVPLPTADIFDTLMALAAVGLARAMYEKAEEQMKDYRDKYNDFMSPITKDMEWHEREVIQRMKDTVNDLYTRGIDPLRSPEGRSAINRMVNSIDTGRIARNKMSAANAQLYLQNKAKLDAVGKYNPDLEERFLGYNINDFSSENGIWDRVSPIESQSLKALTESSFNNRTAHLLTEQDVLDFNMQYDPNAKYKGFTYNDLLNIANTAAPGLTGTIYADYFRDLAKQKLISSNNLNPSEEDINKQLAKDIADQLREWIIKPDADYSDYYRMEGLRLQKERLALNSQNQQNALGWTARQKTAIMTNYQQNQGSNRSAWSVLLTTPQGADKTTALAFAAGISNPEAVGQGIGNKRLPVMFGSNDFGLTAARMSVYNSTGLHLGDMTNPRTGKKVPVYTTSYVPDNVSEFQQWLRQQHIEGFIPSTDVTVNYNVNGQNDIYDLNVYTRVKKQDIMPYYSSDWMRGSGNENFISDGEDIGMVAVLRDGRRVNVDDQNKKDLRWDNIEYIDIPTTRTIEAKAFDNSVLDTYHDAMTLGKSTASKRQAGYEYDFED